MKRAKPIENGNASDLPEPTTLRKGGQLAGLIVESPDCWEPDSLGLDDDSELVEP